MLILLLLLTSLALGIICFTFYLLHLYSFIELIYLPYHWYITSILILAFIMVVVPFLYALSFSRSNNYLVCVVWFELITVPWNSPPVDYSALSNFKQRGVSLFDLFWKLLSVPSVWPQSRRVSPGCQHSCYLHFPSAASWGFPQFAFS